MYTAGGRRPPLPHQERHRDMKKRWHIVVHNLHRRTKHHEINDLIQHLTGEPPLISQALYCKRRIMKAFRITCHYEHRDKLREENFGPNVKISRYDYNRDFPVGKLSAPMPASQPSSPPPPVEIQPAIATVEIVGQFLTNRRPNGDA